ncbi:hypothetical protein K0810_02680 [Erysipelothrix rhusiopathiae]|uniref:hypothetical protein n=1 Tax=Erysipelothrix rhusiopathiae TaxID=1648 RepID=UPI000210B4DC|nr:hypothetical protein [Erysipelothrix rhusiopathiae]AMS11407.1 hypothetical protein A2I91_06555 [Erysipelothrix rhusiopathiae]AOO67905.1 hypothetical protein BC346_06075 [Erysipelothrix rhusiopathiae]AWU41248.1 hypothetical protein DM789_03045 [Erysipelothrix rhusiopathiae]MDE8118459.1 hypothetical protein [Erysipelothrix rhusiopathiae]MDE8202687.1 hypothetical protein [Erysipelothrix rhusiopathiae]
MNDKNSVTIKKEKDGIEIKCNGTQNFLLNALVGLCKAIHEAGIPTELQILTILGSCEFTEKLEREGRVNEFH